jgi:hypothetical protein
LGPSRRLLTLVSLVLAGAARADAPYYAETYPAYTADLGDVDVELWSTLHGAPRSGGRRSWVQQLELETGITDRWDVALYNVLESPQGERTRYAATKVETRYRLSEPLAWPVDTVLYLELEKEWSEDRPFGVEEKLLLGKDPGPLNLALNAVAEQEFIPGGGRATTWEYALGASYELTRWLRAGGEAFGLRTREGGEAATAHYVGPALSFSWSRYGLLTAVGVGLGDRAERFRATAVLEVEIDR